LSPEENKKVVGRVMKFIRQGPFFFYDITRHFADVEYRDLLVAWGTVRSREKFERDEDGRYILARKASKRSRRAAE
jgi:hypothetical protein